MAEALGLGLLLLLRLTTLSLGLDVLIVDSKGLVDLGLQGTFVLDPVAR